MATGAREGGSYTSDADGRLTLRPGQTLEWDSLGRLMAVLSSPGGATLATYAYDSLDRLLVVDHPGSAVTRFRYVGLSTSVAQLVDDTTGNVIRSVGTSWSGELLMDWTGAGVSQRLYGTNGHKDLTWIAGPDGTVAGSLRYDPWGTVIASSGAGLPDFRFQSSWHDSMTSLSWVVTRWYAPALGRFVSEDSLLGQPEEPASRHLYGYGQGDPLSNWDWGGLYCTGKCDPKWVGLTSPAYKNLYFYTSARMRGTLELAAFIRSRYVPIGTFRPYGDDRLFSPPSYTDCYHSRACIWVFLDYSYARVKVTPSCADAGLFDAWVFIGCNPPHEISSDWSCAWDTYSNCNFVGIHVTSTGAVRVNWSLQQSKLCCTIRPFTTIDGAMRINPGASNSRPASVEVWGDGLPSMELYYVNRSGTRFIVLQEWENGPADLAPLLGDWYKKVSTFDSTWYA